MQDITMNVQQAVTSLGIESDRVIRALEVLSANRLAYHPLSVLAMRMEVTSEEARRLLDPYESRFLQIAERHGERAYAYAPRNEEVRASLATVIHAYRFEQDQIRETLGQHAEIQRLREELEFSEDVMRTILNNVGEILIVDQSGVVLATSAFVERLLGIHKGETRAALIRRLTFDPFEEGVTSHEIDIQGRYLECHVSNFVSRGRVVGKNISINDVTEERKLHRTRELYERSRKQLFSIIAHELQNPALGLQSLLQDMLDLIDRIQVSGKLPDLESDLASLKEDVYLNQRGQTLLNRVIADIFDYVKLQRGQMHFSLESDVSVDYLIALSSTQCGPICARKQIRLVTPPTDAYDGIPELMGDSTRLVQVLNNLIKNAIKFTPANGEIRLSVSTTTSPNHEGHDDHHVRVTVSDTGRGMTEEEQAMIFNEYRGAESDGMGLGLMISDLIVKAHGGHITIESQIGHGSAFHIMLPVHAMLASVAS